MGFDETSADIAVDSKGTAYVGWIGSPAGVKANKSIYLCVLPAGATACKGGVQSVAYAAGSIARESAQDLKVLIVNGAPTLIWFNDTDNSVNGPEGAQIVESTVSSTGTLGPITPEQSAPSSGSMLDAEVGPGGAVWTVTYAQGLPDNLEVRESLGGSPTTVHTPYGVGFAHIAFSGSTPIIAITKAGGVVDPVAYSYVSKGAWKSFANVAKTWTVDGDIGLTTSGSGVRLIASENQSAYYPVVAKWNGSGFSPRTLTGDHKGNYPSDHDAVTDASGRVADVTVENGEIDVSNLADTTHAAVFRFSVHPTVAGPEPQVATTPRGHGWVLWAVEDGTSGQTGDRLYVAPIRLAGLHKSTTKHGKHGTAVLTGPASCLPASTISVGVAGHPKHGWKVASHTLKLGSKASGTTLNGASLTPGKVYKLSGKVVFRDGHKHSTAATSLAFRSCPTP